MSPPSLTQMRGGPFVKPVYSPRQITPAQRRRALAFVNHERSRRCPWTINISIPAVWDAVRWLWTRRPARAEGHPHA